VSVGFWLAGRLPLRQALLYVASQLVGALAASGLLWVMYPAHPTLGATLPALNAARAFVFEVVLTFFLMFVIIHVSVGAKEKGLMAGVAVGGTVGLEAMFAGSATGASMNPIRSLAPALVSGNLDGLWIYLTAPFVGAALAVLSCRLLREQGCCAPEDGPCE
jgi:aquaporin Z